jgi:hypothetical protein
LISQNYFQGMMSGLSRVMPYLSTRFLIEIKVSFDAIKITVTGGTKPLRMCSFRQQR